MFLRNLMEFHRSPKIRRPPEMVPYGPSESQSIGYYSRSLEEEGCIRVRGQSVVQNSETFGGPEGYHYDSYRFQLKHGDSTRSRMRA